MAKRQRPYYGLFGRQGGLWAFEFGDFDKECVEFERQCYRDHYWRANDLRLVTWAECPTDAQINNMLAEMNTP